MSLIRAPAHSEIKLLASRISKATLRNASTRNHCHSDSFINFHTSNQILRFVLLITVRLVDKDIDLRDNILFSSSLNIFDDGAVLLGSVIWTLSIVIMFFNHNVSRDGFTSSSGETYPVGSGRLSWPLSLISCFKYQLR
jgi:hypothetical protein